MALQTRNTQIDTFRLPDVESMIIDLKEVKKFQAAVKEHLIEGFDYGIIPGTDKPTLLKPGAEKIDKILKLADTYIEITAIEDFSRPLFFYKIKCRLLLIGTDIVVSEGMGSCSSMEDRYRFRWVTEKNIPYGIDKATLKTDKRKGKYGEYQAYRIENDDIFTQANTILKMAKKRAHIDASLSAGRLSDIFTQDMEDIGVVEGEVVSKSESEPDKTQHWCSIHNVKFFKTEKMWGFAHPIGDGTWCNEDEVDQGKTAAQTQSEATQSPPAGEKPESKGNVQTSEEQAQVNDLQKFLDKVLAHGKQYTPSWIARQFKAKTCLELSDLDVRYDELKKIAGWDS